MLGFLSISRLILHQDEVEKLFDPQICQLKHRSCSDDQSVKSSSTVSTIRSDDDVRPPSKAYSFVLNQISAGVVQFIEMPQAMSHKWSNLIVILFVLCVGSFVTHICSLFLPLASVNAGLAANRSFLYGIMTYHEFLGLLPWVGTCGCAMPHSHSLSVRTAAVIVGLIVAKIFGAFIAEGWWRTRIGDSDGDGEASTVFPIPFSIIVTGTVPLPFVMLVLWIFSSETNSVNFRRPFRLCLMLLFKYVGITFIAVVWAFVFGLLTGSIWQKMWAASFGLFKFLCKIYLISPTAIKLNPKRWIVLACACDLIFARVQATTLPYIDDSLSMVFIVLPAWITIFWRYYRGADRVSIILNSFWKWIVGADNNCEDDADTSGNSVIKIATASLYDIHRHSSMEHKHQHDEAPAVCIFTDHWEDDNEESVEEEEPAVEDEQDDDGGDDKSSSKPGEYAEREEDPCAKTKTTETETSEAYSSVPSTEATKSSVAKEEKGPSMISIEDKVMGLENAGSNDNSFVHPVEHEHEHEHEA